MKKQNNWIVSRREFLCSSVLLCAALSCGAVTATAADATPKMLLRFGIVTDSHYADAPQNGVRFYRESLDKMRECVALMNEQKVDFLIELGDFKDQAKPATEKSTLEYLDEIEKVFAQFKGPRYHVLGNHDVDSISKAQFLAHVENTGIAKDAGFYSFDRKGVHCVVLDANYKSDGTDYDHGNYDWKDPNVSQAQLAWLKDNLAAAEKPVLAFIHQELKGKNEDTVKNAVQVRQILQESGKVLAVFQGHYHAGGYSLVEGIHYYTLKAMIEGSGESNNSYAIVEVYDDNTISISGYRRAVSCLGGEKKQ